jgi:Ni/Co efflux regulator RcnB
MKKLAFAAVAAATLVAPLALASEAAAHRRDGRGYHDDRDHDRGRGRDRHWRRGGHDDWYDRRIYRDGYNDGRRHHRWDHRFHNGYWHHDRWYYGPPPRYSDAYRYDYRAWRRGDRLPAYYRDYYRPIDYRYYGLRPPPRGCHYVRDDRGDFLLVAVATGVILSVIADQHY